MDWYLIELFIFDSFRLEWEYDCTFWATPFQLYEIRCDYDFAYEVVGYDYEE